MSLNRFPRTVDDVTVRVVAAEVLLLAAVAIALQQPWLYPVLAADFVLRSVVGPSVSPLARLAAVVRPRVPAAPRPTAGPPKRFAAAVGAVMTVAATVAWYGPGWQTATWVVGAVMVVFPALEAALGLCVGCLLFSALMRVGVIPRSVCEECADITLRLSARRRAELADVERVPVADQVQVSSTLHR